MATPERPSMWGRLPALAAAATLLVAIVVVASTVSEVQTILTTDYAKGIPALAALATALVTVVVAMVKLFQENRARNIPGTDNIGKRIRSEIAGVKVGTTTPFEIEQLAEYYSLTLSQARVSFWFSLIFAAIGFLIIVGGAALYTEGGIVAASIKIVSGIVVDAVSALFFVQSRRAQEAMSAFFEKLRNDRQFAEARKICEELSEAGIKDHLKTILVLHYSGLEAKPMIDALPSRVTSKRSDTATAPAASEQQAQSRP